jgi:hypothetical protein
MASHTPGGQGRGKIEVYNESYTTSRVGKVDDGRMKNGQPEIKNTK